MMLVVDAAAVQDLDDIAVWIARDDPAAAQRVIAHILTTIEQLQHFPRLSRPGRVRGTFERVVAGTPFVIVLEMWEEPAAIVVTAVVHGARNR